MLKQITFFNKEQLLVNFFSHFNVQQKRSHLNLNILLFPLRTVQPPIPPLVQSTVEEIQSALLHPPVSASKSGADYLKKFFEEEETHETISQDAIDYIMKKITKDKDDVNVIALRNACEKANVAFPKQVAKKTTTKQITNLVYRLAVAYKASNKDSDRYLYTPISSYKSEHIVTSLIQSRNLSNKHSLISKNITQNLNIF